MPRKSLDISLSEHPYPSEKGLPFSALPAWTGLGRAQQVGQGTGPLRVFRAEPWDVSIHQLFYFLDIGFIDVACCVHSLSDLVQIAADFSERVVVFPQVWIVNVIDKAVQNQAAEESGLALSSLSRGRPVSGSRNGRNGRQAKGRKPEKNRESCRKQLNKWRGHGIIIVSCPCS